MRVNANVYESLQIFDNNQNQRKLQHTMDNCNKLTKSNDFFLKIRMGTIFLFLVYTKYVACRLVD